MRIYLRHRLVSLVVAFLAAVGMAAEINAGVWYSSFVREVGRTEQSLMVSVIDTPNGFIASDSIMHYYVKDYQGNVRQVVNADGVVEQDNHYYPYGMLMGESSNILASANGYKSVSFNPYLFGSKEYLTTASANLLDFTAQRLTENLKNVVIKAPNGVLYIGVKTKRMKVMGSESNTSKSIPWRFFYNGSEITRTTACFIQMLIHIETFF